jgi:hypothetical protein
MFTLTTTLGAIQLPACRNSRDSAPELVRYQSCTLDRILNGDFVPRRLEQIRIELAQRIRPFLADLPQQEFDELVDRMAALQAKYETRRDEEFFSSTKP